MRNNIPPNADGVRPEYDASVLQGAVRGKYLERYRAGTDLAPPPSKPRPSARKSFGPLSACRPLSAFPFRPLSASRAETPTDPESDP